MNKKLVISISFLSIFILIGVGYQPIIAEDIMIEQEIVSIVEEPIIEEDCECEETTPWEFPVLCFSIEAIAGVFIMIDFLCHLRYLYTYLNSH